MKTAIYFTRNIISLALGVFFIYKGIGKLSSDKLKPVDEKLLTEYIIDNKSFAPPIGYNVTMNTFKQSGFLDLISFLQIIAGIMIIIPFTRLAGLLILLPIILNIFLMHIFFDNRMNENIVTGLLLASNLFLCGFYYKHILKIVFSVTNND